MAPLKTPRLRINVGNEPGLSANASNRISVEYRGVSFKWLAGTIITGFASTGLMIGALYAAVDGRQQFSVPPGVAEVELLASLIDDDGRVRKGDRLVRTFEPVAKSKIIEVSTIQREGDMDVVRLQPFTRVIASLALDTTEISASRPAFNALNLFAGNDPLVSAETASLIYDADVQGEIAVRTIPFPSDTAILDQDAIMGPEQVAYEVADTVRFTVGEPAVDDLGDLAGQTVGFENTLAFADPGHTGSIGLAGSNLDASAALEAIDTFAAVTVIPENFSVIGKVDNPDLGFEQTLDEIIVALRDGDTIESVLISNGVREGAIEPVELAFRTFLDSTRMQDGQRLRIAMAPASENGDSFDPVRVSLYGPDLHLLTIAMGEDGRYQVDEEPAALDLSAFASIPESAQGSARTYSSIYETALANGIPMELASELIQIFAYDLDFHRPVRPGDAIEVLYEMDGDDNPSGDIVFASIQVGSTMHKFYRFTASDGSLLYFDENGVSANKFLIRNPVPNGRFRSGFGMRLHPILRYRRMHNGVDFSAPRGTPIMAAGNGTVTDAKWSSGYGRMLTLRHANGYETRYAHLNGFARGISVGTEVQQGQVVAYVGSTGLSTGPHLHYEVKVNGNFVDPMNIRVAREETLTGDRLIAFERERNRIDELMEQDRGANIRLASSGL
ncbi:MAG: M23 family metallopeptidase [Pseudomonadota bacterium]